MKNLIFILLASLCSLSYAGVVSNSEMPSVGYFQEKICASQTPVANLKLLSKKYQFENQFEKLETVNEFVFQRNELASIMSLLRLEDSSGTLKITQPDFVSMYSKYGQLRMYVLSAERLRSNRYAALNTNSGYRSYVAVLMYRPDTQSVPQMSLVSVQVSLLASQEEQVAATNMLPLIALELVLHDGVCMNR